MVPGAPSFAALVDVAPRQRVPYYLTLLNLTSAEGIGAVGEAITRSHDLEPELLALLGERNWRPHLPGAIAVVLGHGSEAVFDGLWAAFRTSWVAPQLAAVGFLMDPAFEDRARAYLAGGPATCHAKQAGALVQLCTTLAGVETWLAPILRWRDEHEAFQRGIFRDEWGVGASVAEGWLQRLRGYLSA
jgi:hypothetical protein